MSFYPIARPSPSPKPQPLRPRAENSDSHLAFTKLQVDGPDVGKMYSKPATVASYAAGASLAAVALIYVFGPTFTLDTDSNGSSRKKTIVGLRNQANDCFINSVLQILAGLPDLRVYLIRETHRRSIDDETVYSTLVQPIEQTLPDWKLQGLQDGLVTHGLKDMLDALNERPIYRKSISPFAIVNVLETAFRQRISRQQQDAQEFLQIVAERLKDEYHAGRRARMHARRQSLSTSSTSTLNRENEDKQQTDADSSSIEPDVYIPAEEDESFPMEGKIESQLQCLTCRYRPKPKEETFCTLTLTVPQVNSTSLNECFDGIFKTEHIDDFKCAKCRLLQLKEHLEHDLSKSTSDVFKEQAQDSIDKLRHAIETDPEVPPPGVDLGDEKKAPKRKISRTTRITVFPKILAIHLSRSIYGIGQITQKNSAKVAFPEMLPLGGLADLRKFKLLGMICHRGGHNSGHYEAFRRQNIPRPPFANVNTFQRSEAYSKTPPRAFTPEASPAISTPEILSSGNNSSTPSLESMTVPPRSVPQGSLEADESDKPKDKTDTNSLRSVKSAFSRMASPKVKDDASKAKRKIKPSTEKWWRVSDEKVRESKTSEVLGMQKEVYMIFYEIEHGY